MTTLRFACVGAGLWGSGMLLWRPDTWDEVYARWLLLLAPAAILPLWLAGAAPLVTGALERVIARPFVRAAFWVFAVCALVLANRLDRGALAASACLPWGGLFVLTCLGALRDVRRCLRTPSPAECAELAAPFFGVVGVAWLAFDRFGLRPLDLNPEVVLLTAIHFHYAGVVLPLVVARVECGARGQAAWTSSLVALGGVPLVAVGITATQLGAPPVVEALAALTMSAGGVWVAGRLARRSLLDPPVARLLGCGAALCLAAAMLPAAAYASRHWIDTPWLSIPWMRGAHGSLNALGFAGGASLAAALGARRAP